MWTHWPTYKYVLVQLLVYMDIGIFRGGGGWVGLESRIYMWAFEYSWSNIGPPYFLSTPLHSPFFVPKLVFHFPRGGYIVNIAVGFSLI
jgi:hypothetical protein